MLPHVDIYNSLQIYSNFNSLQIYSNFDCRRLFENDIYSTTIHRSGGGWWWIYFFTNQNSEIIQHKEMINATVTTFSGASPASIREVKSKVIAKFE